MTARPRAGAAPLSWRAAAVAIALLCIVSPACAATDIVTCFGLYYQQEIIATSYQGPLDFLRDSHHATAQEVLKASATRAVIADQRNGYLQIDDSSGTDQVLTMAIYRKADGSSVLVVGSSNCADACTFAVQFFSISDWHLVEIAPDAIVPSIAPAQFIKPGRSYAPAGCLDYSEGELRASLRRNQTHAGAVVRLRG